MTKVCLWFRWSDTIWCVLTLWTLKSEHWDLFDSYLQNITFTLTKRMENEACQPHIMPMFCSGTHRKWKKEVKCALSLWGHRLQTTETSAGACWGLKRLFSFRCNNQLLLIEPQRLEESAGRCYGDTENDEHRLPASVSPQKYAMSMASSTLTHTVSHTDGALGWDSNCPQDRMNVDDYYRGSSRAPLAFRQLSARTRLLCTAERRGNEGAIWRGLFDFDNKLLNVIECNICMLEYLNVF